AYGLDLLVTLPQHPENLLDWQGSRRSAGILPFRERMSFVAKTPPSLFAPFPEDALQQLDIGLGQRRRVGLVLEVQLPPAPFGDAGAPHPLRGLDSKECVLDQVVDAAQHWPMAHVDVAIPGDRLTIEI